jgi:diguanylate cyclase (GGDEF)-like protein
VSKDFVTLSSQQLSRFLERHRRGETLERYHPQLDAFLREILVKANEFVPSQSGVILLDDPQAKLFDQKKNRLTVIASFGDGADRLLGQQTMVHQGLAGQVYTTGRASRFAADGTKTGFAEHEQQLGIPTRSMLGLPVILGASVCGVLLLINRREHESVAAEEHNLMEIFAGYISSSIQNTLDGIRAKELAQRDDLTGLYNDRYLHHRLRAEIRSTKKMERDLSLLFLDLDNFKEVNDRYGHLDGSRTLHLLGILLGNSLPEQAVAARYGGDEFVVILPETSGDAATDLARRLLGKIADTPFVLGRPGEEQTVFVTASFGVASLLEHVSSDMRSSHRANDLIRLADAAMYRAKARGKNRVVAANPPEEEE